MSKAPKNSLTVKHWIGYMMGDWGGCMTFALMSGIFSMYCTNVLGINASLMGVLTIIWTIWDAINDPIMGALMDKAFIKKRSKAGTSSVPGSFGQLPWWPSAPSLCGPCPPSWTASPC